ncbi:MAG: hypothetical protein ACI8T1_003896 [Verrucomicrobiales bacterium]|jgi:uncharacterized protein (DUF1501 family)
MNSSRRQFLRRGCLAGGALAFHPFLLNRTLHGAEPGDNKKLLFIFQRGGNDGINTVIPRGDSEYNTTNRPSLFIPEAGALDLGNGFAQLHPSMAPMMSLYNSSKLTGVEGPGNLAVIHRVGYANQSRSHFNSQEYWEKGAPRDSTVKDGLFYRQIANTRNLSAVENSFVAASISGSQLEALQGEHPFPNFREAGDFAFLGDDEDSARFLGKLPTADQPRGKGVRGLYSSPSSLPRSRYADLVRQTGQAVTSTLGTLKDAVDLGPYVPANGAVYPDGSLGEKLTEAAMLMKRTPVRVVGVNVGSFDTHSNQGAVDGKQANLLEDIAAGFQALSLDLQEQWEDVIVVTMTEFGRTSKENGGRGTDHAEASTMFVGGGGVNGGVYNCDSTTWNDGDMFSKRGRYLERRTDFRSVFGEIFTKHFGNDPALLDTIMPGYSLAADDIPGDFAPLGIL